jgi:hypothetical protein
MDQKEQLGVVASAAEGLIGLTDPHQKGLQPLVHDLSVWTEQRIQLGRERW